MVNKNINRSDDYREGFIEGIKTLSDRILSSSVYMWDKDYDEEDNMIDVKCDVVYTSCVEHIRDELLKSLGEIE